MGDFCSVYCKRYDKCDKMGITDYMKVIPKHPDEVEKNWCGSFEDNKETDKKIT